MGWDEAVRVTMVLVSDPGSAVGAAVTGLEHPLSREGFILADLFGVYGKAHFKNPKPHPLRPAVRSMRSKIDPKADKVEGAFGGARSKRELLAAFAAAGIGRAEPN